MLHPKFPSDLIRKVDLIVKLQQVQIDCGGVSRNKVHQIRSVSFLLCIGAVVALVGCAGNMPTRFGGSKSQEQPELVVSEPTTSAPVSAGIACIPIPSRPGEYDVHVKVKVHSDYYLHAPDPAHPESIPLTVAMTLPDGVGLLSEFQYPDATMEHGFKTLRGDMVLRGRIFATDPALEGQSDLSAIVKYQACSEKSCLPPAELTVQTSLAKK